MNVPGADGIGFGAPLQVIVFPLEAISAQLKTKLTVESSFVKVAFGVKAADCPPTEGMGGRWWSICVARAGVSVELGVHILERFRLSAQTIRKKTKNSTSS